MAQGQSGYYNLDGGRPTRVEDAAATARNELEIQLPTLRLERFDEGTMRWRVEPKVALGVLPFTELELRLPIIHVLPRAPAPTSTGITSLAVGLLHAFNLETSAIPALAIAGEFVAPVGSLSASRGTYAFKALATKTFPFARVHVNVGGGSWNVRVPSAPSTPGNLCGTGAPGVPECEPQPIPPDVPCDVVPIEHGTGPGAAIVARCAGVSIAPATAIFSPRSSGMRWVGGVGVDRALPLRSTLIAVDLVVERFYGLYARSDWTTELGVRHQITPQLVVDLGVGRRFHGATRATSATFGLTYGLATSFLRGLRGERR